MKQCKPLYISSKDNNETIKPLSSSKDNNDNNVSLLHQVVTDNNETLLVLYSSKDNNETCKPLSSVVLITMKQCKYQDNNLVTYM